MEEDNVNTTEPMNTTVPATVSFWSKVKKFLCQDIVVELTPKQEKVFQEVGDFWHQEITAESVNKVLMHEITWQGIKDFWLQKIEITL